MISIIKKIVHAILSFLHIVKKDAIKIEDKVEPVVQSEPPVEPK